LLDTKDDIEARFKELCKDIDNKIKNKEFDSEFENLIFSLKEEFELLIRYYNLINRELDALYITHNFYIRYSIWEALTNQASFIASYSKALMLLLERYLKSPYSYKSLTNQIKMFSAYMINIKRDIRVEKQKMNLTPKDITQNAEILVQLCDTLNKDNQLREKLLKDTQLSYILYWILRSQLYYTLKITNNEYNLDNLNLIEKTLKKLQESISCFCTEDSNILYAKSLLHEGFFKAYKQKLFAELRKKEKNESIIKNLVKKCKDHSKAAERHYRQFKGVLKEDYHDFSYLGHKIDILMAEYFERLYVKKKIIKAIKKLGEVRSVLMEKSFENSFEALKSTGHIRFISQEYHLLQTYLKLLALYSDIVNLKEQLPPTYEKWILDLFSTLEQGLAKLVEEFYKYPRTLDTQHELKLFPRTFIGSFSEYVVYQLIERINSKGIQLEACIGKEYLSAPLIEINNTLCDRCKVEFRYRPSKDPKDPDIDIAILNETQNLIGISVKNGHLKGNLRDIKHEFDLAKKHGFRCFIVVINFLKNIDLVSEITNLKHHLLAEKGGMSVYFIDLKDFVECLIDNVQKQDDEFLLPMPKDELLYSLDY